MKMKDLCLSAVHILSVLFIGGVGLLFALLPYVKHIGWNLASLVLHEQMMLSKVGLLMIGVAASVILLHSLFFGRSYIKMRGKKNKIEVDVEAVEALIGSFWISQSYLPVSVTSVSVVAGSYIEIMLDGDPQFLTRKRLAQLEKELACFLDKSLGYRQEFWLCFTPSDASVQSAQKPHDLIVL